MFNSDQLLLLANIHAAEYVNQSKIIKARQWMDPPSSMRWWLDWILNVIEGLDSLDRPFWMQMCWQS